MKQIKGLLSILLLTAAGSYAWAAAPDSQPGASQTTTQTTSPDTASVSATTSTTTTGHTPISFFDQKLPVTFTLSAGETYDDNIFIQPTKSHDWVTDIQPGVDLAFGDPILLTPNLGIENPNANPENESNSNYLSVTYHPTFLLYADHSHLDTVDEFADALYAHQFSKLTLSIEQSYAKLSQPTIQTSAAGSMVDRDVYVTTARANYVYSDKLSTYGTFTQTVTDFQTPGFTDSNEWTGDYYFLYQVLPKLSVGFGPRFGFVDIVGAPNQTWQAGLVHFYYTPTGKLAFTLDVGAEDRQYESPGPGDKATPILDATGTYQPFDSTTISLSAGRDVHASNSFIGQNYTASRVQLGLRQRFVQVVYFNLNVGYEHDQYNFASSGLAGPERQDDYYYVKTGLEWDANDWLTVNGYYQYSEDNSNFAAVSFNDNQFNIGATLKY
ncbi:MAG: outer membrane beta-barrel protein [Methylacidiphilales bacterium]|nr:outer membrane beta-barrel protein [Candidatus Methylacidiphilales bacterium]